MNQKAISAISIFGLLCIAAYFLFSHLIETNQPTPKKELLVYCGITMIQPISEIASIIEQRENVKISIIKGGSGNLLESIKFNQIGDLYLPGSESYIEQSQAEGLVSHTVHVGYNKAAMMVREGNPKSIQHSLDALKNPDLYVVIGNPDSGSIGKETKKILMAAGIFNEVMKNAKELTTDSKRLIEELKNDEADLVINWYATSTWKENADHIDAISIDENFAVRKQLVLGLLTTSKYPGIAKKLMAYAASEAGQRIFDKYGLYNVN
ncbi:MAG: substrate-binding domain-containing protein [Candidatus Thiodiazotropha sp. (ex Semelilucina semeliformis)]|nr:substrate-binding domain-containing protein [Candidatus Thiodiazotropha sp. (ex Semelilucina semeliformis)]